MQNRLVKLCLAAAGLCLLGQGALADEAAAPKPAGQVTLVDQFRVTRLFFEASGGSQEVDRPGVVTNRGDTEAIRAGVDAALPLAFQGGFSFRGAFSSGSGIFGSERLKERRWSYGPEAYLQHRVYGPLSLGVAGGYSWLTGKNTSNFGVVPGLTAMNENSHETFWTIYAPVVVPVAPEWAVSATPSFGRSDAGVSFTNNDPTHQGSHTTAVNFLTAVAYGGIQNWVLELGTTTHFVVSQSQPRNWPTHSDIWTSPLIGATYFLSPEWALHGQVSTDVADRWMESVGALVRIERHF